jgi:4-amino-4-deoxy-L-arabinose transferase-like glycosyltransferase
MSWIKKIDSGTIALGIILLFAFAIRAGYVLTLEDKVFWVDEQDYLSLSQTIVDGNGYVDADGQPTAFRPIGYPLFLSALRLIGFESLDGFRIVQCVVGAATAYVIYLLTVLLFSELAGILAALFYSIYPYFIFLPGTILASTWFSFILVITTYILVKGLRLENNKLIACGGLLLGYATLVRPSAFVLIVPVIVWLFINTLNLKSFIRYSTLLVVTLVVVIAPWIVRNYIQIGVFNFSTNGGRNLWLGNNQKTTSYSGSNMSPTKELELKLSTAKSEVETDRLYGDAAIEFIKTNPRHVVKLFFQKAFYFWRLDPSPTTEGYVSLNKLHMWMSVLSFGPILILALVGFAQFPLETKKMVSLFLLYGIMFTVLHAVYFPKVRFRLPIDQFLIVLAANALVLNFHKMGFLKNTKKRFSNYFLKSKLV